ncbi:MAG: DUF6602 domain-containing protein [Acidobacteriota bacterium]
MPRHIDSAHLNLHEVFSRVQARLLADIAVAHSFEHPTAAGTANENLWLDLFAHYLPARYRASPAFIINASGRRSRQIDIAIYDHLHCPPLFPHAAGNHIPIESVCAVFEVKPTISKQWLRDAGAKAASVRALQSNKRFIPAGLLAATSVWQPAAFTANVTRAIHSLPAQHAIQYGCALEHGAFENLASLQIAPADQALIFFPAAFDPPVERARPGAARRFAGLFESIHLGLTFAQRRF